MPEQFFEKTLSTEEIYKGKVVTIRKDKAELIDGSTKIREVVMHPGGVVVAAITDNHHVLLVRQFRYPVGEELIELPAGKLEYGEDPDDAIKRELEEECGYKATNWTRLACVISTPGFCDEKLYLYKATGLIKCDRKYEEGEFLEGFSLPLKEAWQMVLDGRIKDMKSVAMLGLVGANS